MKNVGLDLDPWTVRHSDMVFLEDLLESYCFLICIPQKRRKFYPASKVRILAIITGQADSEAEDSEMTEKLQSNEGEEEGNDQSNDLSQSEDENEPMESDYTKDVKMRQSPSLDTLNVKDTAIGGLENGHVSPMSPLVEVLKKCNFPSDILTLRKVEESVCYQTGLLWTVSPAVPLPKGSSIGPYTGKMVALGELKEREHILQVNMALRL